MSKRHWPLRWLWPLLLIGGIAWPEWSHQQFDRSPPSISAAEAAADAPRLREIAAMDVAELDLLDIPAGTGERAIADGSIEIAGLSWGRYALQGYPQDIEQGPPTFRWFMAGLGLERLLLNEYEKNGKPSLLEAAEGRILQFARHERERRWDLGFLWNDHAIANRASVLVQLWALRQQQPGWLQSEAAAELLALIQRSARLLADPRHFTARTNHGWIQSLALLQLSAAFPQLPQAAAWRDEAERRLRLQLPFYVSPEGVVLEHSPRYHAIGVKLLAQVQRLRHLQGLPGWPALDEAVSRSSDVLDRLLRPDATVPGIGNSDAATRHRRLLAAPGGSAPLHWPEDGRPAPGEAVALLPAAGWALSWLGDEAFAAQLLLSWAWHPGHGHKHADEGGLNWWAAGQDWLNPVGYWPYGIPLVRDSYDWPASNAAHGQREPMNSARTSRLLAQAQAPGLAVFDLERQRADGARFRRQVLQLGAERLLVLDFLDQVGDGGRIVWNFAPRLLLQRAGEERWSSSPRADGLRLHVGLARSTGVDASLLHAGEQAIPGWTTQLRIPQRGQALQLRSQPGAAVVATLFELQNGPAGAAPRFEAEPPRPEAWQLRLADGRLLSRQGGELRLDGQGLALTAAADSAPALQQIRQAHQQALVSYPPFRTLYAQRLKIGKAVIALALGIELLLLAWRWLGRRRPALRPPARLIELGLALGWGGLALFLLGSYLRV